MQRRHRAVDRRSQISHLTAGYWQNGCCPVGWLVSRVCRVSVCLSALKRQRAARSAVRKHSRRGAIAPSECIIQRRFAIRVDSVPSCKLGPARTRPRVLQGVSIACYAEPATSYRRRVHQSDCPSVCPSHADVKTTQARITKSSSSDAQGLVCKVEPEIRKDLAERGC